MHAATSPNFQDHPARAPVSPPVACLQHWCSVVQGPGDEIQPTPEPKPGEASAPLGKVASYVTIIQPLEEWFEGQVQDARVSGCQCHQAMQERLTNGSLA